MRPLVVYLDSSDYSNLNGPMGVPGGDLYAVRTFLHQATNSGRIEVRYSSFHLMEASHLEPAFKPRAVARARLIEALSGSKVMRDYSVIAGEEVKVFEKEAAVVCATSDEGRWYPAMEPFGEKLKSDIKKSIAEVVSDKLRMARTRNERRLVEKDFGSASSLHAKGLRKLGRDRELMTRIARVHKLPAAIFTDQLGPDWLLPGFPAKRIEEVLIREMTRPSKLIEQYAAENKEDPQWLPGPLRALGTRFQKEINHFRDAMAGLDGAVHNNGVGERERAVSGSEEVSYRFAFRKGLLEALMDDRSGQEETRSTVHNAPIGALPGIDLLVGGIVAAMSEMLSVNPTARKPLRSDAGDYFHMFYIPYVDIWRGDRYATQLVNRIDPKQGLKVVPLLVDLPTAIERRLRERSEDG